MTREKELSRRQFIRRTSMGAAAGPLLWSSSKGSFPNSKVNHAVIGTGSRGMRHVQSFESLPHCQVIAVCDVDPERLEKAASLSSHSDRAEKYSDYRFLLENKDIDSVCIATCDHWHTPIALAALLAGKHVYVEKPCSHNIYEANLLASVARDRRLCVQHGTQRRSSSEDAAAVHALREGLIGEVLLAKAINHQRRKPIGMAKPEDPPKGVDYDLWLGPAPKRPFTRNRWHYNWHWFWDYGGGDLANDGIHQLDVAIWGMGLDQQYPSAVVASGGQLWYDDDHETPDTQNITYEYEEDGSVSKTIVYEMRLWTPYELEGHDNGTVFYGTEGKLHVGRKSPTAEIGDKTIVIKPEDFEVRIEDITSNFVASVLDGAPDQLNSPISLGVVSTNLCHLGNIATRCGGGRFVYSPQEERIVGGEQVEQANKLIRREYRRGFELETG